MDDPQFVEQQIQIARVYYCPYHPIDGVSKDDSPDRRLKRGMLVRALTDVNLDVTSSVLVGGKLADIDAATGGWGWHEDSAPLRSGWYDRDLAKQCCVSDSLDDIRYRFFSPAL